VTITTEAKVSEAWSRNRSLVMKQEAEETVTPDGQGLQCLGENLNVNNGTVL
jgi:hypothetical protein